LRDSIVAITGGTGSFGQAMVKELLTKGVNRIRVLSRDELKQAQMKEALNDSRVDYFLCDVRDAENVVTALEGVDVVIHAAALKRIEKCETNPLEAIKTNVQGSINVAKACLSNNVKSAIFISTDKAAYPVNLYGATKLTAEKLWTQSNTYRGKGHPTKFSVVRYGNVLGSRGSVLHIFKDQLAKGPIRVTDSEMTRFFITLQEAVDLVQLAVEFQQGGEIFIPELKSASIYQLAKVVAGDRPIEITSQRGGEKLHESLVTIEERTRLVSYGTFSVINPEVATVTWPYQPWTSELQRFASSSQTATRYTDAELKELLKTL
jgi:UDP-N-acetylglucosamine 4,6-dehydratase